MVEMHLFVNLEQGLAVIAEKTGSLRTGTA